MGVLLCTKIS